MNRFNPLRNSPRRLLRTSALVLLSALPLSVAVSPLAVAPAYAAQAADDEETGFLMAKKSKIVQIALPEGAFRYTGKKEIAKYSDALAKLVGPDHGPLGEAEVLLWQDGKAAQKALPDLLKKAGYGYAAQEALRIDAGRIIPFVSTRPEGKGELLALWIEQGDAVMLAWAVAAPAAGKERAAEPEAAPAQQPAAPGNTPTRTTQSRLTGLVLAAGAQSAGSKEQLSGVAAKLSQAAQQFGVGGVDPSTAEMIGWESGSIAPRTALYAALQKAGYERTDHDGVKNDAGKYSFFSLVGPKDALFGMWMETGTHLILAWGRVDSQAQPTPEVAPRNEEPSAPVVQPRVVLQPEAADAGNAISLEVAPATFYVNVMKGAMPRLPQFPMLAKKAGMVRGYVYDTSGKPLKGAKLGVRSTAVGGFYSGGAATTDERGYYEIAAPAGVAHFYCAGYAVDYGEGLAAVGLHPAGGEAESFATPNGQVQNFVLLPYGIADRAGIQDDPHAGSNYYGGSVVLGWNVDDGGVLSSPNYLPNGGMIEFTLTPDGPLLDGSRGKPIIIRKAISAGSSNQLYINNIPVGPYQVSAKLVGGGALKMRETGPYGNRPFGLEPKEGVGKVALMLRPNTAKADMVPASHGSWSQVSISLNRP